MTENHISETSIRGEIFARVKDLAGFSRFHREPDNHSAHSLLFIREVGSRDLSERASLLFKSLREAFRYKRREMSLTCDDGNAFLETPDFAVAIALDQDPEIARNFKISTEVRGFTRCDVIDAPQFSSVFAPYCDRVAIAFARPFDLDEKIDSIEENPSLSEFLDYDPACSWLSLKLPGLFIEVTPNLMTCRLPPGEGSLAELIVRTHAALARISDRGFAMPLPPKGR